MYKESLSFAQIKTKNKLSTEIITTRPEFIAHAGYYLSATLGMKKQLWELLRSNARLSLSNRAPVDCMSSIIRKWHSVTFIRYLMASTLELSTPLQSQWLLLNITRPVRPASAKKIVRSFYQQFSPLLHFQRCLQKRNTSNYVIKHHSSWCM